MKRILDEGANGDLKTRFESLRRAWWPVMQAVIDDVVRTSNIKMSLLHDMVEYQFHTGGKRLRAILPLLTAEALGCDPGPLAPFGAACEMLHNASLVHDDLQDGDTLRRGREAVWKKFGMPQAINLGDAMIAYTLLLVRRLEVSPALRDEVSGRLLAEMLKVIDGQVQDLALQCTTDVTIESYIRMAEGKTSSLFALPMGAAALLCGAPESVEKGLVEAACHIGVLFQIQDDITDIYGDGKGKPSGSDVRAGKRSILAAHCLERGEPDAAAQLRKVLDKPREETTVADVDEVRELFEASGSLVYALAELERRKSAALSVPALASHPALLEMLRDACNIFLYALRSTRTEAGSKLETVAQA